MNLYNKCNIDKVFLVNLKKRKDRKLLMEYKLSKMNIDYELIEGIDGSVKENINNYNIYLNYWNNLDKNNIDNIHNYKINTTGAYSLLLTYKKIINIVKKNNYERILIFEDDIVFHKNFYDLLESYDNDLFKLNDVIWLGGNQERFTEDMLKEMNEKNYYNISNKNYFWTYGCYSIILNRKIIDLIDKEIENIYNPYLLNIDVLIWNLIRMNNLKGIVLYENLIIPQVEESDNMGSRDINAIANKKKWLIDNYEYFDLTSDFKKLYKDILYNTTSIRNNKYNKYKIITNVDVSKLIEGNNKSFVFIIPSYNNEKWYKWNLDSIFNQCYPFWRIIYVDDASNDNTKDLVKEYVKEKGFQDKFKIIEKKINTKQAHSRWMAYQYCYNDEICCMVDGDDALYDDKMLLYKINKKYLDNNLLISYGEFYYKSNSSPLTLSGTLKYTLEEINNNNYRNKWVTQHLRTCEARLLKTIPENYMKYNGEWLKCCTDVAEMWWVLELSEGRHMNLGFPTYYYNKDASIESNYSYYNKDKKKCTQEKHYRNNVMDYLTTYKHN